MTQAAALLNQMRPACELREGDVIDRALVHRNLDIDYDPPFADDSDCTVTKVIPESETFTRVWFEDHSAIRLMHDFDVVVVLRSASVGSAERNHARYVRMKTHTHLPLRSN